MQEKESKCPVKSELLLLCEFAGDKLCGKCIPCQLGTMQAIGILKEITAGSGKAEDLDLLSLISVRMEGSSMCKLGKKAARELHESLREFQREYEEHTREKRCQNMECDGLITYRINPQLCNMCGDCKKICDFDAIIGEPPLSYYILENVPYRIRSKRCANCGKCLDVCPQKAIEVCQKGQEGIKALTY